MRPFLLLLNYLWLVFTLSLASHWQTTSSTSLSVSSENTSRREPQASTSSKYPEGKTRYSQVAARQVPMKPQPSLRGQGVLVPELEPIRQWIQQNPFVNQIDSQIAQCKDWIVTDISFWMNAHGSETEFKSRNPFIDPRTRHGMTGKLVDLVIKHPTKTLINLITFVWYTGQQPVTHPILSQHNKYLSEQRYRLTRDALRSEFHDYKCYVVSIGSGYAFLQGFRRYYHRPGRPSVTDKNYLALLRQYQSSFRHVHVEKPGSSENLGFVISYRNVECNTTVQGQS